MPAVSRRSLTLAALCCLLAASLAANAILYPLAVRPLFLESDRPLIERTAASAAIPLRTNADELRRRTFPVVLHLGDRTCVDLRAFDGAGNYGACYDRGGKLVEETASVDN
jgi:hypothetical protein